MEAKDKLIRARIRMQRTQPFFAYLVLNLRLISDDQIQTCGVNAHNELRYNPVWIEGISEEQIITLLCHEVGHIIFEHLLRTKQRDASLFNIAGDICINNILSNNNFVPIAEGLIPHNNAITIKGTDITITDIDQKNAETIYNELSGKIPQNENFKKAMTEAQFNEKIEETKKSRKQEEETKKWKQIVTEAATIAQQQGKLPAGMDRQLDELLNEKVNWKHLLYQYITNELPHDYTYSRPSRRSRAAGFYMPSLKKENIEVMVSVDTSGSISQENLTEFVTEMVSIAKSFSNLKMTIIVCDSKIHEVLEVTNGNIAKILNLKMKGGGGTDHRPIYELIREQYPQTKFLIAFTDGYTQLPEQEQTKTIWVMPNNEPKKMPYGQTINL